jgi:hypothetical protein
LPHSPVKITVATADSNDRALLRIGGIAAIALGVGYLIIFPLYAMVGAPPNTGEAWLAYLPGKTTTWWMILGLSVLTDVLFLPFGFALYVALKDVRRNVMLIATALVALFVVLDLAVTWANYASLLTLSDRYGAATSESQRAVAIAAASYAAAVLASRLEIVYAILVLSIAILMIAVVMMNGAFGKPTAFLGMATGVLGILSIAGWGVAIILNAIFATLWILFTGARLCRLGRG